MQQYNQKYECCNPEINGATARQSPNTVVLSTLID